MSASPIVRAWRCPPRDKWNVDTEVNRIELQREGKDWKIISGL